MIIIPQKGRKGPFSLKNGEFRLNMGTTSSKKLIFSMKMLNFVSNDVNFRSKMFKIILENVAVSYAAEVELISLVDYTNI